LNKKNKIEGHCKICGKFAELSFEHVPPKSCFNTGKYISIPPEKFLQLKIESVNDYSKIKGKIEQGGIGYYSLCYSCNNNTGSWYGDAFVDWSYFGKLILLKSQGNPTLYYPTHIFPLRVIKQIITMFFTLNYDGFAKDHPELVRFILNKEQKYLDTNKYRIWCYYKEPGLIRQTGTTFIYDPSFAKVIELTEMSFSPFGYVFTIGNTPPDKRLSDITYYANYDYNSYVEVITKFPVLPVNLIGIPGDYRTKDEIDNAIKKSLQNRNPVNP